jgi:cyanophycinase
MLKIFIATCTLSFSLLTLADTHLILIGGGTRPAQALEKFVAIAGGNQSRILVITWATRDASTFEIIQAELKRYGAHIIEASSMQPETEAELLQTMEQIKNASAIYFTGGDQTRILSVLSYSPIKKLLQEKYQQGVVFAGTSAGTAIMSHIALTGVADLSTINASKVEVTQGLGLLPNNIIVDQHFIVRSRYNRLAALVFATPNSIGLGVDENNAIYIRDQKFVQAFGPTQTMVMKEIDAKKMQVQLLYHLDQITF